MGKLSKPLLVLHWAIIVNFVLQIGYGFSMVFFVVRPEGISGPLAGRIDQVPHELMVTRRLYALETWVAIGALAIYLAVTEILPRRLAQASPPA